MKTTKRLMAILLSLAMLITMTPAMAFAADGPAQKGTKDDPIPLTANVLSEQCDVAKNDKIYFATSFDKGTECKIVCFDKRIPAWAEEEGATDVNEEYIPLKSSEYTLKVSDENGEVTPSNGLYILSSDADYSIELKYLREKSGKIYVNIYSIDNNVDDAIIATNAYSQILAGIENAEEALSKHDKTERVFHIADPEEFGSLEEDEESYSVAQAASDNILDYLGTIYKTEVFPFYDYLVQIHDPDFSGKNGDSMGYDTTLKKYMTYFDLNVYALVFDTENEKYLSYCRDEDYKMSLYLTDYPKYSAEDNSYDLLSKDARKINNTEELKEAVSCNALEIRYVADITTHIPTDTVKEYLWGDEGEPQKIDLEERSPDWDLIEEYEENGYPGELYIHEYNGSFEIGTRDFDFELIDIDNTEAEKLSALLSETADIREDGWYYGELRVINTTVQRLNGWNAEISAHPEGFFGGIFKEKYDELVSGNANLSLEVVIPSEEQGDILRGHTDFQGDYYINEDGEKVLCFTDKLNGGVNYDDILFVSFEKDDFDTDDVIKAAQERVEEYFKDSDAKAKIELSQSGCYLTKKGVAIPDYELDGVYQVDAFPRTLQNYIDGIDGEVDFESLFGKPVKVIDCISWNNDDDADDDELEEEEIVSEDNEGEGDPEYTIVTGDAYPLYDITISSNGKDYMPLPFAIVKADSDKIKQLKQEALGRDSQNVEEFGDLSIESQSGVIPFDLYIDKAEKATLDEDKWNGNYAAVEIVPGSTIAVTASGKDASGNAIKGYSMKVTATGVELSGDPLVSGDAFCVWDETNKEYLKDENGNVKTFLAGKDGAVEFEAKHFSTYAIIPECTHKTVTHVSENAATATEPGNLEYWVCDMCGEHFKDATDRTQKYVKDEWVIPATGGGGGTVDPIEEAFKKVQASANASCDALLEENKDSKYPYIAKLVDAAKKAISEAKYDSTKSAEENQKVIADIVTQLQSDVEAQKVLDDKSLAKTKKVAKVKVTQKALKTYKSHKIKLTFKRAKADGKKITSYQIYRKTGKNGTYKRIKTVSSKKSTITYTNKKLKKGKTYYYKVRGVVTLPNTSKAYTKFSTVKKIKCK